MASWVSRDIPEKFQVNIRLDYLTSTDIHQLLQQHLQSMALHSRPESIHALGIDALRQPGITLWTAWENSELLGRGALKALNAHHAEIKSMRTASTHLRKGVAKAMLAHMVEEAKRSRYQRLSLETGSAEAFEPARRLYAAFGFTSCEPFADYLLDPYSVFMTREI